MGGGVLSLGAVVIYLFATGDKLPAPQEVKLINLLTSATMLIAVAAIAGGELLWRRILNAAAPADADAAVTSAFIVRLAGREGGAMLGMVTCLLAALNGVMRAYPAYWVNLAPAALFLFFLYARWPTLDGLRAQVREL